MCKRLLSDKWLPLGRAALGILLLAAPIARGQSPSTDWSIAFLDQLLAGVQPGQKTVRVGDMEILVANLQTWRNQLAGQPTPRLAFDGTAPTWPGGNVYYTFDSSVSALHQKAFLDGANEWAIFVNIRLLPRTTQTNYMTVLENPSLSGGQSAVGMIGGQQFLQVGPTAWNRPTVCHEFGHTLGLVHEHQRSDRDSYVVVLTNNIMAGEEGNFVLLSNSRNQSAYDFLSVMHYNRNSFAINQAQDTLEPLPAYSQYLNIMGQQFDPVLSAADRAGVAAIYGAGPPVTSVVTNTQDSGPGSLRAALYYGFDHPGTTVTFNIPTNDPGFSNRVFTIQPTAPYLSLVNAMIVDGSTQTNFNTNGPAIQLNGALAPPPSMYVNGLRLGGTNCSVRSLIINGFTESAIWIDGTNAVGNTVRGCYLGVDPTATRAVTNGALPLLIDNGASDNTIGGTNAVARNIISGSAFQGMVLRDPGTRSNVVEGNYIGLNAAGTAALPNGTCGVNLFNGAQGNTIGGSVVGARNVISGNAGQGIVFQDPGTSGNVIQGNYIGLDPSGSNVIANSRGVDVYNGPQGTVIGGAAAGAGNVVSGNLDVGIYLHAGGVARSVVQGNYVGLNAAGTVALGNHAAGIQVSEGAQSNLVGGTLPAMRNVVSGNLLQGVLVASTGTTGNSVEGNYIGVSPSGTNALPNGWAGVNLSGGATGNLIGGTASGAGNLISGNGHEGVLMQDLGTSNNVIQGNFVGVDFTGLHALANTWSGVELYNGPQANLVGGGATGAGNLISGNANYGVLIQFSSSGNFVQGNFIGVNAAGAAAVPNTFAGVGIFSGSQSNLIGGVLPGQGNVVSGNTDRGVIISDAGTVGNMLQGNYIGVDFTGTNALANQGWAGIDIFGSASGNVIGGVVGARNVISGNAGNGISLSGNAASHVVQGNSIGLNAFGTGPLPNGSVGITLFGGAVSNQIGGTGIGAANFIADNSSSGVQLSDVATTNNPIRANSIFGNTGGGIALFNSANRAEALPILSNAVLTTSLMVTGSLTSLASTAFHLDFYANPPPSGGAQAKTYIGTKDIVTSGSGKTNFFATLGAIIPIGQIITAAATDPAGNTSPLSTGVAVTGVDSVGDGIPNAWRAAHFGGSGTTTNSQSCATCDPDHDGMNNLQEFLAGTNPTNAASVLRISSVVRSNADILVSFQSATGIVYRIENRFDIGTPGWSVFVEGILGSGAVMQLTDPEAAALPRQFYRLGVEP